MNLWRQITDLLARHDRCVLVTITQTSGSVPRDTGTEMAIASDGEIAGTIGGGELEYQVIRQAMQIDKPEHWSDDFILGPDLGQCCGGHVHIEFQRLDRSFLAEAEQRATSNRQAPLLVFGAGHVGKALIEVLMPLPFDTIWIDPRQGIFPDKLPTLIKTTDKMPKLQAGSMAVIMTHSHELDYQITRDLLMDDNARFVGLIGSKTKRARFIARLKTEGITWQKLVCPIGIEQLKSKIPQLMAVSIAAQLLIMRETVDS